MKTGSYLIEILIPMAYMPLDKYKQVVMLYETQDRVFVNKGAAGSKSISIKNIKIIMKTLKYEDKVVFRTNGNELHYTVQNSYLNDEDDSKNTNIFQALNFNEIAIENYAEEMYGYSIKNGGVTYKQGAWPQSKEKDFEALTRLVEGLQSQCDNSILNEHYLEPIIS